MPKTTNSANYKVVLFIAAGDGTFRKPYKRFECESEAVTAFARARELGIPAALFTRDESTRNEWVRVNSCHLASVPRPDVKALVSAFTGAPAKRYFNRLAEEGERALACATPWELAKAQDEARLRLRLAKKRHVLKRYHVSTMEVDTVAIEGGILTRWLERQGYDPSEVLIKIDASRKARDLDSKLRMEDFVENGIDIDGVRYRFLLAAAGEAKQARCTAIDEKLLAEASDMLRLQKPMSKHVMVPAKFDAAMGLSMTGSVPFEQVFGEDLLLEDIVLLNDVEFDVISKHAMVVNHGHVEHEENRANSLPISDGQGYANGDILCYLSGQYRIFSAKMLIDPTVKPLPEIFLDAGISHVKDVYGNVRDVRTIKCVLHTSCVKTWQVFSSWEDYCQRCADVGEGLCVVRLEAPRHAGKTSYTMLQTLVGTDEHVNALADKAVTMLNDYRSIENAPALLSGKLREAAELYPSIMMTASCAYNLRTKYAQRYMESRGGKFHHMVENVFLISDPTAVLTGTPLLQAGECHCSWIPDGKTVILTRFPHTNESCWIRMVNRNSTVHQKAFASKGSCYVNAMDDSGLRDRWDFDGDKVVVVTDPVLQNVIEYTLDTLGERLYDWVLEKPAKKPVTQGARENALLKRISGGTVGIETDYLSRLWGTVHNRVSFNAVVDAITYQVDVINNDIDSIKGSVFSAADREALAHWRELRQQMESEVMYGKYMYYAKFDRMRPERNERWDAQTRQGKNFLDCVSQLIGQNASAELGEIDGLEDLHFSCRWLLHEVDRDYNATPKELYGHEQTFRTLRGRTMPITNVSGFFADIVRRNASEWKRFISKEEMRERQQAYADAQAEQARLELSQWGLRHNMDLREVCDRITVALFHDETLDRRFMSGNDASVQYAHAFHQFYWNVFGDMVVDELRRKMGEDAEEVEVQSGEDEE